MRLRILALTALLSLARWANADDGDAGVPAHSLIPVSRPDMAVTEAKALCFVAPPGQQAPLELRIVASADHQGCVSLESAANPGYFLRHQDSRLKLHPYAENDWVFANDSSFYLVHNADGTVSFRSYNFPKQYIYVTEANELYIGTDPQVSTRSFRLGD